LRRIPAKFLLQHTFDLAEVGPHFPERKREEFMAAGVTIQLPETVLIEPDYRRKTALSNPACSSCEKQNLATLHHSDRQLLLKAILDDDVT